MNLKKPKFWNYKRPNLYAYSLLPFAFLLKLINLLKIKTKKKRLNIKTICIGNIYIGGTGKTSLCLKISEILNKKGFKVCFVKKFYKNQIDEQNLLRNKGKLFLSKKRLKAINQAEIENYEIAILDDGLQDNSINYNLKFLCFNNINWIGNGLTIPAGPLREDISNIKNYNHIFLNGNLENLDFIKKKILEINEKTNIHIGKYEPLNLNEFNKNDKYLAFSGIGNHETFISMIKNYGLNIFKEIEYPDHYAYNDDDIKEILKQSNVLNCKVITTEKDYLRLKTKHRDQIKYIKTELKIIDEEKLVKVIVK